MKKLWVIAVLFYGQICFGQNNSNDKKFNSCAAVFLNNVMIVDKYSTTGKCQISKEAIGEISAGEVSLGDKVEITSKISFGVAIKNRNSGTILLFSSKTFKKIDVQQILSKCNKGDSILILTTDDKFALPHNEILVF
jgi:hypothetical protein